MSEGPGTRGQPAGLAGARYPGPASGTSDKQQGCQEGLCVELGWLSSPKHIEERKGPGVREGPQVGAEGSTGGRQGRWFKASTVKKDGERVQHQTMDRSREFFPVSLRYDCIISLRHMHNDLIYVYIMK